MAASSLKKIAADLNLSVAAVSAAMGGCGTARVSEETAARVRAYAQKVNYRPSLAGKALRSQHLHQIAILVEGDFGEQFRSGPITDFPAIFGLNNFLRDRDWQLHIIDDCGHRTEQEPLPRYLRERFIDGLVVSSTSEKRNDVLKSDFARFSIPAIFMNAVGEYNCISIDDHLGACLAARHLIELGHQNILFVGTASQHYSIAERKNGYQQTLKAAGLRPSVYVLEEGHAEETETYKRRLARNKESGQRFLEKAFLKQRPTGIVCYDDRVALIVMKALYVGGFNVPKDVSIVGFNDMPFMDMLPVSLTTVRADFHLIGRLAGELLLDLIQKGDAHLPSPIIKPELAVRESTCAVTSTRKNVLS